MLGQVRRKVSNLETLVAAVKVAWDSISEEELIRSMPARLQAVMDTLVHTGLWWLWKPVK